MDFGFCGAAQRMRALLRIPWVAAGLSGWSCTDTLLALAESFAGISGAGTNLLRRPHHAPEAYVTDLEWHAAPAPATQEASMRGDPMGGGRPLGMELHRHAAVKAGGSV